MKTSLFQSLSNFFNARLILVAVLSVGVASASGYYYGVKHTNNAHAKIRLKEQQIEQRVYDAALRATSEEIAKIKITNTTIRRELEREVRKEPVYLDCKHTDNVKRMLDAILTGEAPFESFAGFELPTLDTSDGQ